MNKVEDKSVNAKKKSLSYYYLHKFKKQYKKLIKMARKENPLSETIGKWHGRKKEGKLLPLVEHLVNYKASVRFFVHNLTIAFDNN